jgi:hypothetical protein
MRNGLVRSDWNPALPWLPGDADTPGDVDPPAARGTRPIERVLGEGDGVLVVAPGSLRAAIVERARARGHEVFAADTPLAAIHTLERFRDRIGYVVVSPRLSWEPELRALVSEEFPELDQIVLAG